MPDAKVPGLTVRSSGAGRSVYTLRLVSGPRGAQKLRRVTIGPTTLISLSDARKRALKLLAQHADVPIAPAVRRGSLRVGPAITAWANSVPLKPRSAAEYQRLVRTRIVPAFGTRAVATLTRRDVRAWHASMGDAPPTANRALAVLSSFCTHLLATEQVPASWVHPCRYVAPFPERSRVRSLDGDEFSRLGHAMRTLSTVGLLPAPGRRRKPAQGAKANRRPKSADKPRRGDPVSTAAILFLLCTGLRKIEALSARWADVDLTVGRLRLPDSKTGERWLPLAPMAVDVLRQLWARTGALEYVFPAPDGVGPRRQIRRTWDTLRAAAALQDFRLHDLRHTFASQLATQGESLVMIGHLLGHKRLDTTQKYAHLVDAAQRAASTRAVAAIGVALAHGSAEGASLFPAGIVAPHVHQPAAPSGARQRDPARRRDPAD